MSRGSGHEPIRSYQRIFQPDRRIYQIEGHALPVPGGVPLRWLGYASAALVIVLALSARTAALPALLVGGAAITGLRLGGPRAVVLAASVTATGAVVLGAMLASLDWPIRLLVVPALVATAGTQATPDGRSAHRYALSWLALQLRAPRRSAGRRLRRAGERVDVGARVWIASDPHTPTLRRGRVHGPALARFAQPITTRRRRSGRIVARPDDHLDGASRTVRLDAGERLEVRP
jgi:hypothetical protein